MVDVTVLELNYLSSLVWLSRVADRHNYNNDFDLAIFIKYSHAYGRNYGRFRALKQRRNKI